MSIFFATMKIHYVTSNKGKFEEAAEILQFDILQKAGFQVVHTPLHLEEIQGLSRDIALHKIREAYSKLHAPCLIDDISINCPSLGGLPGPYIRSFLEALGDEGVATLLSHYADKSCQVVCHIAFAKDSHDPLLFEGVLNGQIVMPRGDRKPHTTSWNAIVQPEGSALTFAEMSLEKMSQMSARALALTHFRNYLLSQ